MKFGVREICDVVFKSIGTTTLGETQFSNGQPVLYIDTAKTSTLEGAATTVYAEGGKGNTRLLAWEGEKTLTFTVEDALLSEMGFAVLSGAGLVPEGTEVLVHMTTQVIADAADSVTLKLADTGLESAVVSFDAGVFLTVVDEAGAAIGSYTPSNTFTSGQEEELDSTGFTFTTTSGSIEDEQVVIIDYYVLKSTVTELSIEAGNFAGFYYVEAATLFRDQATGKDYPAEIIIPKAKIQSNFTFEMAATGDPSTFSFVMDAFPGKTVNDPTKDVLCVIQIIRYEEGGIS